MSSELDYLDKILNYEPMTLTTRMIIESIKEKIQRLESIDNAKPNEALKCLEEIDSMQFHRSIDTYVPEIKSEISETQYLDNTNEFYTIKQALIKAQEQEKVLEIIKEKDVDIFMLNDLDTLEEYNGCISKKYGDYFQLTQEEFNLLKRWLG